MKKSLLCARLLLGVAALTMAVVGKSQAITLTWDTVADDATTITPGSGTWDLTTLNWNDGVTPTNVPWTQTSPTAALNAAVFGGADGTYAINVATPLAVQGITFNNSGYTLSNATTNETITTSGDIVVASGVTATIGSHVIITRGGTYTLGNGTATTPAGTLNISGTVQTTSNTLGISGLGTVINVLSGGTLNDAAGVSGRISVGTGAGAVAELDVNGGTVSTTFNSQLIVANAAGATGTVNLNSGNVNLGKTPGSGITTNSPMTVANGAGAVGTFNLNGGTLATDLIQKGSGGTATFNFNGGTLKVNASVGSAPITNFMTGLDQVNIRNGGAIINTNNFSVTIDQTLQHSVIGGDLAKDGGLTKLGAGTLTLTAANTYTGDTTVFAGTLSINTAYLSDSADVSIVTGGIFDLNFTGSDTIAALSIDGVTMTPGTWGSSASGATNVNNTFFSGTGVLNVTAVPEPSIVAMLALGGILGLQVFRRRQA